MDWMLIAIVDDRQVKYPLVFGDIVRSRLYFELVLVLQYFSRGLTPHRPGTCIMLLGVASSSTGTRTPSSRDYGNNIA